MSAKFVNFIIENIKIPYSDGEDYEIDKLPIEIDWSEENSVKAYVIYTSGFKFIKAIGDEYRDQKKFEEREFDISRFKKALQKSEHWYSLLRGCIWKKFPEYTEGHFGSDISLSELNV